MRLLAAFSGCTVSRWAWANGSRKEIGAQIALAKPNTCKSLQICPNCLDDPSQDEVAVSCWPEVGSA